MWQPTSNLDTPIIPVPQNTIEDGLTPTPTPSLMALTNEDPFLQVDTRLSQEPVPMSDLQTPLLSPDPRSGTNTRPKGVSIAPFLPLPPSPPTVFPFSRHFPPYLTFPHPRSPSLGVNPNSIHPPNSSDYLPHGRSVGSPIAFPPPPPRPISLSNVPAHNEPGNCPSSLANHTLASIPAPPTLTQARPVSGTEPAFGPTAQPESSAEMTSVPPVPSIPQRLPTHISPSPPSLPNIPHVVWLPISPNSGIPPPIIPGFREGRLLSLPLPSPLPSHRPPVPPTSQSHVGDAAVPPTPQVQHPSEVRSSHPRHVVLPDGRELIAMTTPNGETAYVVDPLPAILRMLDRATAQGAGDAEGEEEIRSDDTIAAPAPVPPPTQQGAEEPLGPPPDVPTPFSTGTEPPCDLSQIERDLYELSFPPTPSNIPTITTDHILHQTNEGERREVRRPRVLSEGRSSMNSPRKGIPKFDWRRKFKIPSSASGSGRSEVDIPRPPSLRRDVISTLAVQGSATTTDTTTSSASDRASNVTSIVGSPREQDIWWIGVGEKHHDPSGDLIIAERECRWRISMEKYKRDSQLISHLSQCPTKGMTLTLQAPSLPCQASRPSSDSSGSAFDIISVFLNYLLTHDMKDLEDVENVDQFESLFILCDFFGCPAVYQNLLRYIDENGVNGIRPWQLFVVASKRNDTNLAKIAIQLAGGTRTRNGGHRDERFTINLHHLTSKDVKDVRSTWMLELFKKKYEKMLDGRFREVPWEIVAERFNPC
ncbi:uncharacterized protein L199_000728 [Kwoniella botswanensis]|uniref:uncharacterized protein n=1 Tax=Kwoniella botswanensis TaxID=1268659 RepID=UPI00315D7783